METIGSQSGFMYWGESEGWGIAATQHRDSEPLERSNFAVIRDDLQSRDPENVTVESARSDFVGWVEFLLVKPGSEAWRIAEDWRSRLADYPVADDDHFSETEETESVESIAEFLRSEFAWHEIDYAECAAYVVNAWMESGTRDLPGMTYTGWPKMDRAEDRDLVAAGIRAWRNAKRRAA
jgi:hypothetical protein